MPIERDVIKATRPAGAIRANIGTGEPPLPLLPEPTSATSAISSAMSEEERLGREKMDAFFSLPEDQQKARIAVIYDRGVLHDRLHVDLPSDLHGEWCRNNPLDIDRMRTLGFWVDTTYATKRQLHSDGTASAVVADVIHVVTTKQNKQMIDKVVADQRRAADRDPRHTRDESQFLAQGKREPALPLFSESNHHVISQADVKAALERADAQTQVQQP